MNPSELNRLLEMAARFDPTLLAAQAEQASKMFDPARLAAQAEQVSKMFDPARLAAQAEQVSKMFDPARLAAQAEQVSKMFDPARLAAQAEQVSKMFDPARLAWDERWAAAVGQLETRAEGILAATPEPELKTVEALSADMGAVIEAAPAEAREETRTGLTWLLVFLVDALAGDPAKEAVRHALLELLVVLSVMVTDPTLPTPPPAPALQQPDALVPVSAPPSALILPGGWAVEGLPNIVLRAGAAGRGADGGVFHGPNPEPAHGRGVRRGRDAVLHLVRRARARARADFPDRGGHLHRRDATRVSRPHDQAAPGRHPPAVRLAGDRPGNTHQPGHLGARGRLTSSGRAKRRCSSPPKRACCWTPSTPRPSAACAIARCWP